jgi:hypothetical protein
MYYILVRVWTVIAFILTVLIGYVLVESLAELSLFLGCGVGLLLWLVGVLLLAALLRPKRPRDLFDERYPPANHTPA